MTTQPPAAERPIHGGYPDALDHSSDARDMVPSPAAPAETDAAEGLAKRLSWACEKLRECGSQVEFTLGMCRTLADAEQCVAAYRQQGKPE